MTQHALIIEYIKLRGSICPAKLSDDDKRMPNGEWLGSETGKRCRELRAQGKLTAYKDGKYEVFRLAQSDTVRSFLQMYPSKPKVKAQPQGQGVLL